MEIKRKEVDCIFFEKLRFRHNRTRGDWEPGCCLRDYYCASAFEGAESCSCCIPSSNRNKVCEILDVCLESLGLKVVKGPASFVSLTKSGTSNES